MKAGKGRKAYKVGATKDSENSKVSCNKVSMVNGDAPSDDSAYISVLYEVHREFYPEKVPQLPALIERARSIPGGLRAVVDEVYADCDDS